MPRGVGARGSSGKFVKKTEASVAKTPLEEAREKFLGQLVMDRQGQTWKCVNIDEYYSSGIFAFSREGKTVRVKDIRLHQA